MRKTISLATLLLLGMLCSKALDANCCCSPNIVDIRVVPFTIDGTINPSNTTYCITNNLTYVPGEGDPSAAITVAPGVHDIIIEFNNYNLHLDPAVNGISMQGTANERIENVTIKNGTIQSTGTSASNSGIFATNFTNVHIEDMRFIDTRRGFNAPSQTDSNFDLSFASCQFEHRGVESTKRGISLGTIQGLVVDDCTFLANSPESLGIGILLVNNATNVRIKDSRFDGQTQYAIDVQSLFDEEGGFFFTFASANIQIDRCEFTNNFLDVRSAGASNLHVTNSTFYGTLFASIINESSDANGELISPIPSGMLVDACTFTATGAGENLDPFGPIMLFAGSVRLAGIHATDVIISNSTFSRRGAPAQSDDIQLSGVEGALVENCVFDFTGSGRLPGCVQTSVAAASSKAANIHLGGGIVSDDESVTNGNNVKDVIIRGNEIFGGAQVGIYAETSKGKSPNERITIENNSITAIEEGILLENTHASTVIGNVVQGVNGNSCKKGVGIKLAGALTENSKASSSSNAILNNIVSNNTNGITLKCGAQGNLIKGNYVFSNDREQIKEVKDKTNVFVDNTSYSSNNAKINCEACSSSS